MINDIQGVTQLTGGVTKNPDIRMTYQDILLFTTNDIKGLTQLTGGN